MQRERERDPAEPAHEVDHLVVPVPVVDRVEVQVEAVLDVAPQREPRGEEGEDRPRGAPLRRRVPPHRRGDEQADEHHVEQRAQRRMRFEGRKEQRFARDHLRSGPAQHAGPDPQDLREALDRFQHQRRAPDDDRNRDRESDQNEQHAAVGRATDREHVVDAHHGVGHDDGLDRAADRRRRRDLVLAAAGFVGELPADPGERGAPDQQEAGDLEEPHDDRGQRDPDRDGPERAPEDHLLLVLARHVPRGEPDDDRVVAGEHAVDHDDRRERRPPRSRELFDRPHRLRGLGFPVYPPIRIQGANSRGRMPSVPASSQVARSRQSESTWRSQGRPSTSCRWLAGRWVWP